MEKMNWQEQFLSALGIQKKFGVSRYVLEKMMKAPDFPKKNEFSRGWKESEVEEFLRNH